MSIMVVGDTHGKLDQMYAHVQQWEREHDEPIELVLQVGDFGAFPDMNKLDRATKQHWEKGDGKVVIDQFPRHLRREINALKPTIFIKGNHEDFDFLEGKENTFIAENIFYLGNGSVTVHNGIRIGGIGGNRSGSNKYFTARKLHGWRRRHFTQEDIARLAISAGKVGGLDILLTHDSIEREDGAGKKIGAPEITSSILALQPSYAFSGHYHAPFQARLGNTAVYGMAHFGSDGCFQVIRLGAWAGRVS
jgi:predicted phosphodiesterase